MRRALYPSSVDPHPVDVRIDVIDGDVPRADVRTRTIGRIKRGGREFEVVGTYLGVVADEN